MLDKAWHERDRMYASRPTKISDDPIVCSAHRPAMPVALVRVRPFEQSFDDGARIDDRHGRDVCADGKRSELMPRLVRERLDSAFAREAGDEREQHRLGMTFAPVRKSREKVWAREHVVLKNEQMRRRLGHRLEAGPVRAPVVGLLVRAGIGDHLDVVEVGELVEKRRDPVRARRVVLNADAKEQREQRARRVPAPEPPEPASAARRPCPRPRDRDAPSPSPRRCPARTSPTRR